MFNKSTQYSYREQRHQRNKLIKVILIFLVLFIIYNCLTAFFFSVWVVDNNTMQPGLSANDRIIFTSLKPPSWTRKNNEEAYLFDRGSIVLVDLNSIKDKKWPLKVLDTIVRFFTAQRVSIFAGDGQYYIKRVIAFPGDEISMTNYIFRVKTKNSLYSLTEFELSDIPYSPLIPNIPELWDDSLPFSGNMDPIILGPDECFVISDDRSNTNDSRTWGPLSTSQITARAVIRIWPLNKIQLL